MPKFKHLTIKYDAPQIAETTLEKLIWQIIKDTKHSDPSKSNWDRYRETMHALLGAPTYYARPAAPSGREYDEAHFFRIGRAKLIGNKVQTTAKKIASEMLGGEEGKVNKSGKTEHEVIFNTLRKGFQKAESFYMNLGIIIRHFPFTEEEIKQMSPDFKLYYDKVCGLLEEDEAKKAVKMKKLLKFLKEEMGWNIT